MALPATVLVVVEVWDAECDQVEREAQNGKKVDDPDWPRTELRCHLALAYMLAFRTTNRV